MALLVYSQKGELYHISSNKRAGRMPTWGAFIERNTVWFLQLPLLAGARDCRQCSQAQQVQNPTIFLPINAWAECRLGVRLLEEIQYLENFHIPCIFGMCLVNSACYCKILYVK